MTVVNWSSLVARAAALVAVIAFSSTSAHAGVISFTGAVTVISAPADARLQALESNIDAPLFLEVSNFLLGSNIAVDITSPGLYDSLASLTSGAVNAG